MAGAVILLTIGFYVAALLYLNAKKPPGSRPLPESHEPLKVLVSVAGWLMLGFLTLVILAALSALLFYGKDFFE